MTNVKPINLKKQKNSKDGPEVNKQRSAKSSLLEPTKTRLYFQGTFL